MGHQGPYPSTTLRKTRSKSAMGRAPTTISRSSLEDLREGAFEVHQRTRADDDVDDLQPTGLRTPSDQKAGRAAELEKLCCIRVLSHLRSRTFSHASSELLGLNPSVCGITLQIAVFKLDASSEQLVVDGPELLLLSRTDSAFSSLLSAPVNRQRKMLERHLHLASIDVFRLDLGPDVFCESRANGHSKSETSSITTGAVAAPMVGAPFSETGSLSVLVGPSVMERLGGTPQVE